jgi:hypothetical protein
LTAPYPPPPPGSPAGAPNNTLGLVSMILGIAAIVLGCCPLSWFLGIPVGVAAAITGFMGKQKADQGLATNRGQAQAGFICGIIGAAATVLYIVLIFVVNVTVPGQVG